MQCNTVHVNLQYNLESPPNPFINVLKKLDTVQYRRSCDCAVSLEDSHGKLILDATINLANVKSKMSHEYAYVMNKIVQKKRKLLQKSSKVVQVRVEIAWVKAHIGTEGNEAADKAARPGAENKNLTLQKIDTPIPAEHEKSIIEEAIRKERKRKWKHAPRCKHTELFHIGPDKNRAKCILNLSRSHLTKLISIITGFNCHSYIQFKADPTRNPLCDSVKKKMRPCGILPWCALGLNHIPWCSGLSTWKYQFSYDH